MPIHIASPIARGIQRSVYSFHSKRKGRLMMERLEPRVMFTRFVETVDNPSFPLLPGTEFTYAGTDGEGGAMRIEVSVLEKKKLIAGVRCTVALVNEYVDGALTEKTFDWYAQDRAGNVWYFGENSTEIEDDVIVSRAGSWQAGVNGAEPGLLMAAHPRSGDAYRQEFLPGVAEDQAHVVTTAARLRTSLGKFRDVVVTAETTPLEPDVLEYKYYARGLGLVRAIGVSGEMESVELTEVDQPIISRRLANGSVSAPIFGDGGATLAGRADAAQLFSSGLREDTENFHLDLIESFTTV